MVIRYDGEEYRVPSLDATEAGAYYTTDKEDAYGTAKLIHGKNVAITIRRVNNLSPHKDSP